MISINGTKVNIDHFPDGTLLIKQDLNHDLYNDGANIQWNFENNEELVALVFITNHLRENGIEDIYLYMPYVPNARQDRVKYSEDVFTLKYFAKVINSLQFNSVSIVDPHSNVSEALFDRVIVNQATYEIEWAKHKCKPDLIFYPDEGAMKRYSSYAEMPYVFGIKKRDWKTGEIKGLDVCGDVEQIKGKDILIIDDICSKGGTFYHSAKKLKELGAKDVYLYVSHCENTIFQGELLKTDLIKTIYTTNSIFTNKHEKIIVLEK